MESKFQVQHSDGSPLAKDEAVSVVNLFPESVFSRVNVFLNGMPIRYVFNYMFTNTNTNKTHVYSHLFHAVTMAKVQI